MKAKLLTLRALSSTRVGAGRGLGHIDLPIVREKVTNFPYVPASSVKGVLADDASAKATDNKLREAAFGKKEGASTTAGSLVFTDARLLALPILSFYGTFALVSCPAILNRLKDDLGSFDMSELDFSVPTLKENQMFVPAGSALAKNGFAYLLDVDFKTEENDAADKFLDFLKRRFQLFSEPERRQRFAIVSDDAFAFLCETGTEVSAHIRIDDEKKTVAKGALWYEETVPAETCFYGFVCCDRVYDERSTPDELLQTFCPENPVYLQFGGKSSTGKGRCVCSFISLNGGSND